MSKLDTVMEPSSSSPVKKSPRPGELKFRHEFLENCSISLSELFSLIHHDFAWICNTVRGKAKLSRPAVKQAVEGPILSEADNGQANESAGDRSPVVPSSSISSPNSRSPLKSK